MIPLRECDLTIGEEVIVINKQHLHYNKIGEIWKITRHSSPTRVSVIFDGEVSNFDLTELAIS